MYKLTIQTLTLTFDKVNSHKKTLKYEFIINKSKIGTGENDIDELSLKIEEIKL